MAAATPTAPQLSRTEKTFYETRLTTLRNWLATANRDIAFYFKFRNKWGMIPLPLGFATGRE